ncbi:hypothetical protein ACQV5M_11155 [Leptospira sp. SA-E8]
MEIIAYLLLLKFFTLFHVWDSFRAKVREEGLFGNKLFPNNIIL